MGFPGEWTDRAACKGKTEIFFPERGDRRTIEAAKAVCKTCRVKPHCKEWVVNNSERGIWAGMTRDEVVFERRRQGVVISSAPYLR